MTANKHPWEIPFSELVKYQDTLPRPCQPLEQPRDYSEAELHRVSLTNRLRQTEPPVVPHYPAGTWMTMDDGTLYQLRKLPVWTLCRTEEPKPRAVVQKYARWFEAGSQWPPLRAVETNRQRVRICDGHHRLDAANLLRLPHLCVWVAPVYFVSMTSGSHTYINATDFTHERAVALALKLGIYVPYAVRRDYPRLSPVGE